MTAQAQKVYYLHWCCLCLLLLKGILQLLNFSLLRADLVKDFEVIDFDFLLILRSFGFFDFLLWIYLWVLTDSINLFTHFIDFMLEFLIMHCCVEDVNFHDLLFFHYINFVFFSLNFLWQRTRTSANWYCKRSHHIKMDQLIHQRH